MTTLNEIEALADQAAAARGVTPAPLTERSRCGIHGDPTSTGRCASCDLEREDRRLLNMLPGNVAVASSRNRAWGLEYMLDGVSVGDGHHDLHALLVDLLDEHGICPETGESHAYADEDETRWGYGGRPCCGNCGRVAPPESRPW